jgi:hypothetical protein
VPTGRTVSPEAKRNLVERSRPRPRVPRATKGAVDESTHFERPPKMGTGVNGTYFALRQKRPERGTSSALLRTGA